MGRFLKCAIALLFIATGVVAQNQPVSRIPSNIDGSQRLRLRGSLHSFANPAFDHGRVNPTMRVRHASIVFHPSTAQQKALEFLLEQQRDPASPSYHQWLTPEQYADRFGMSTADLAKVSSWLKSQGLQVDGISRGRNQIFFSGAAANVEQALGTELHQYVIDGEPHFANATEPSIPAALGGVVTDVHGLNNFRPKSRAKALPHFTSNLSGSHFIVPADFATIYNVQPLYAAGFDGTGQQIAVVGQSAISRSDVDAFRAAGNLSSTNLQLVLVPGSGVATTCTGDVDESSLDVQWSGGVAQNAAIIFVFVGVDSGKTCASTSKSVWDSLNYAVQNSLAPVISTSYGFCEAGLSGTFISSLQQLAQQANSQGQTIVAASGDAGAADCETNNVATTSQGLGVDVPASIPEVTGLGGTEFTGDAAATVSGSTAPATSFWGGASDANGGSPGGGSALKYIPEMVWNDTTASITAGSGFSAGGGGVSKVFAKPSWQTGTGVPVDGKRDVPDISLSSSAMHDGYLICVQGSCVNGFRDGSQNLTVRGGTSVASPSFAGIVALINQATESNGQGNVNPNLYTLVASTPTAFHDITTGNNKVPCTAASTDCTTANSHLISQVRHVSFATGGGFLLVSIFGLWAPARRRKIWVAGSALLLLAFLAVGVACGGGSSSNNNTTPPPPANISIGFSATTGYDLASGLGSIDADTLAGAWPGFKAPGALAFTVSANAPIAAPAGQPGTTVISVVPQNLTGTVTLTCRVLSSDPGNDTATCSMSPTSVALSGTTKTSTLSVTASPAGSYLAIVDASNNNTHHFVNVPVTAN